MAQVYVSLFVKLASHESLKDFRSESLIAFAWRIDQRLVPFDDEMTCIEKRRQELCSLLQFFVRALCPAGLGIIEEQQKRTNQP